jgi:hypothetical protein
MIYWKLEQSEIHTALIAMGGKTKKISIDIEKGVPHSISINMFSIQCQRFAAFCSSLFSLFLAPFVLVDGILPCDFHKQII